MGCRHPQGKICENLKYNLQQYKYRGQKELYKALVEGVIVGPESLRSSEAEAILGQCYTLLSAPCLREF